MMHSLHTLRARIDGGRLSMSRLAASLALLLGAVVLTGCATVANPDPRDPLESYNRSMTNFNEQVDAMVLKPVATAYKEVMPGPVRTGVSNFFANLGDVWSFVNNVLRLRSGEVTAQVFVGDELRGETPIELELLPGLHQVTVRGPNIADESFTVTAVVGEQAERDIQVKLKPEQQRREQAARPKERRFYTRWWVWTLASIGAVGIATAIIVPTVLAQRSSCEKLGGEVCFPVELAAPALTSSLVVRF